jgi:hypothetical protein
MSTSANDRRLVNYVSEREGLSFAQAVALLGACSVRWRRSLIQEMIRLGRLTEAQAWQLRRKI